MGLASIIGQVTLILIFFIVVFHLYSMQQQSLSTQIDLNAQSLQLLQTTKMTNFQILQTMYQDNTISVQIQNTGSSIIDRNMVDTYVNSQIIPRSQTAGLISPCRTLPCGQIGFGHEFEQEALALLFHFNNQEDRGETLTLAKDYANTANMTLTSTTYSSNAPFGQSLQLNGSAYGQITGAPSVSASLNYTWVVWVYPTVTENVHPIFTQSSGSNGYRISIQDDRLAFRAESGPTTTLSQATIPKQAWSMIAITFSNNTITMYLDGEQLLSTDTTMTSTSEPLYIGTDGFNFYQGLLDEFAFYQRTLTSQEIGQLYQKTVEIQNPRLWDPQEFAQIDIYKPLESGSHIITFSTQSGIQQTATVEVS